MSFYVKRRDASMRAFSESSVLEEQCYKVTLRHMHEPLNFKNHPFRPAVVLSTGTFKRLSTLEDFE